MFLNYFAALDTCLCPLPPNTAWLLRNEADTNASIIVYVICFDTYYTKKKKKYENYTRYNYRKKNVLKTFRKNCCTNVLIIYNVDNI